MEPAAMEPRSASSWDTRCRRARIHYPSMYATTSSAARTVNWTDIASPSAVASNRSLSRFKTARPPDGPFCCLGRRANGTDETDVTHRTYVTYTISWTHATHVNFAAAP